MKPCVTRTTRLSIMPEGETIFSELCTHVTIEDEAAGEFLVVKQQLDTAEADGQTIQINPEEWPALKGAIETLFDSIQQHEQQTTKQNADTKN